jgi:hypothetical protein
MRMSQFGQAPIVRMDYSLSATDGGLPLVLPIVGMQDKLQPTVPNAIP